MISPVQFKKIGLFLGPILFIIVLFIPIPQIDDLSLSSKIVLATTLWMAAWWITETIPIYITALLPLIIFPSLGVMGFSELSNSYADRIIFLFLGGFLLAKAVEKTGLHKRFAYEILKIFGTSPTRIIAGFMLVTWVLGAWMSNTATAILMLPIALAILTMLPEGKTKERFVVCLLLAVAYSANISGVTTLIGTPPNAIFASLAGSISGVEVTFSQWLLIGAPISGISLLVIYQYLIRFGSKITDMKQDVFGDKLAIGKRLKELGRMNRDEKLVALVFGLTVVAWISRGILWKDLFPTIDDSIIVITSVVILFLIPSISSNKSGNNISEVDKRSSEYKETDDQSLTYKAGKQQSSKIKVTDYEEKGTSRLLDWNTAVTIPWGVLILIGGGLALAEGFTSTGLGDWIASQISFIGPLNYLVIILLLVAIAIIPSELISNTATAALLIPIAASLALSMDVDPLLFMAPVAIATSYGFIMPVGTPPNAIVYSTGYVTMRKMARAGIPLDLISIVLVTILTTILVPLVFTNN